MKSGPVPQHPPIKFAPAPIKAGRCDANCSAVVPYTGEPSSVWGRPAFALIQMGSDVAARRRAQMGTYSAIPVPQFAPTPSAPSSVMRRAACSGVTPVMVRSLRLPLRSYSINKFAALLWFRWRNPDSCSEWSVAELARARASADPAERARILAGIAQYNEDDLLAMRAVWHWMMREGPRAERA